jgi:hypothetical protein
MLFLYFKSFINKNIITRNVDLISTQTYLYYVKSHNLQLPLISWENLIKDPAAIKKANKLAELNDRDSTDLEEDSNDSEFSDVLK